MTERLEDIKLRFEEVGQLLMQPEITKDMKKFSQLSKEYKDLEKVVTKYNQLKDVQNHLQQAKDVLSKEKDQELRELAKMEIDELEPKVDQIDAELKELLIPKDPNDDKNVLLEVRAGTGGDEAALFAGDLWRMYQRYAASRGWQVEIVSASDGEMGGYKEVVAELRGKGVFGRMKFESGVHRVQRVPATEGSGRI